MAFDTAVRLALPSSSVSAQPQTAQNPGAGPAALSGSRVVAAARNETSIALTPASGSEAASAPSEQLVHMAGEDFPGEAAEARIEAAQRAYHMTLRAAGVSTLHNAVG